MMHTIPSAPGRLPLLGHLLPLMRDPLAFLSSLSRYGDLVCIGMGPADAVVVCDPGLTQQVLRDDRIFDKGGPLWEGARDAVGDGLASCAHSLHRRQRRLLQPAFHPTRLSSYAAVMSERIDAMTSSWQDGEVLDVCAEMKKYTSSAAMATLFGDTVSGATMLQAVDDVTTILDGIFWRALIPPPLDRLPTSGNRKFQRAIVRLRKTLGGIIADRHDERADHGDLLSALLAAHDIDGTGLTDLEITDQLITFFIGGTETASTTLAWALHLLDRHPDITERLHAEVDSVLAGRPARQTDLPDLELTSRIITEALRLRGPGWVVTRRAAEDTELGGHRLPAGTAVVLSAHIIHHRPDLYVNPELFDPDRWDSAIATQPSRNAVIPFGGGARKCIGDSFAIIEMTLALATIANRWNLHARTDQCVRPVPSFVLHPRDLRMRAATRTPSAAKYETTGEQRL